MNSTKIKAISVLYSDYVPVQAEGSRYEKRIEAIYEGC